MPASADLPGDLDSTLFTSLPFPLPHSAPPNAHLHSCLSENYLLFTKPSPLSLLHQGSGFTASWLT